MPTHVRHVFLTGFPGVGKTTTMLAAIEDLGKVEDALTPEGFFTQEIRDDGTRVGFDVVTVGPNPRRGPLARLIEDAGASPRPRHRVGRYAVDVASLEALACPALSGDVGEAFGEKHIGSVTFTPSKNKPRRHRFVVLDEIGAMECLSDRFERAARLALETPTNVVLGSMCVRAKNKKKHAFANAVAARPDVAVVRVATETRDALRVALVDALRGATTRTTQDSQSSKTEKTEKTKNDIFSVPIAPLVPFLERGQRRKLGLEEEEEEEEEEETGSEHTRRFIGEKKTATTERNATPCGPLVVDGDVHARLLATGRVVEEPFPPPKTLLLGETSSPAPPPTQPELAYAERSMWRVLDEALAVDEKVDEKVEEKEEKEEFAVGRRETRRVLAAFRAGLAVWDVAADVHVPGEKRSRRSKRSFKALNDILGFLKARPSVTAVAFVGEKAWRAFRSASENADATRETFSRFPDFPDSNPRRRRWIAVDGRAVAVAVVRSARGDERERREKVREWSEALFFRKEGEETVRGGES